MSLSVFCFHWIIGTNQSWLHLSCAWLYASSFLLVLAVRCICSTMLCNCSAPASETCWHELNGLAVVGDKLNLHVSSAGRELSNTEAGPRWLGVGHHLFPDLRRVS